MLTATKQAEPQDRPIVSKIDRMPEPTAFKAGKRNKGPFSRSPKYGSGQGPIICPYVNSKTSRGGPGGRIVS